MKGRDQGAVTRDPAVLAWGQGLFNVVGGVWPLVSPRSFEWIFGHKQDRWLQQTVAGLLLSTGWAQLRADTSPEGLVHARRVGLGTAVTLLTIDVVHVARRRIKWTYLLDGAMEACWIVAWLRAEERPGRKRASRGGARRRG